MAASISSKDLSVAPKERINIKFVPATGDQQEEVELPFKTVVLGDFTGRSDDSSVESRPSVSVDKNNFNSVLEEMKLERTFEVKNTLSGNDEDMLKVDLKFERLKDFEPDQVALQIEEVKKLVELREALVALKGPLGNMPAFRNALKELLEDDEKRETILQELEKQAKSGQ